MNEQKNFDLESSQEMTETQDVVYEVETFLSENYHFRRNVLSGKNEVAAVNPNEEGVLLWEPVTTEVLNSIVRRAKKNGIGGKKSPKRDIEEYVSSNDILSFNPIREYLESLPEWDGKNHVAELFGRLPGITSEQLAWCSVWMRSMVALDGDGPSARQ